MRNLSVRFAGLLLLALVALGGSAEARTINILAIGASNTAGRGVSESEAWPAVLESILRAKGHDVHVTVHATNGITSTQIVSYTDSIPAGTQIVIFDAGVSNDRAHGISPGQSAANEAEIMRRVRAHGAVVIKAPYGNGKTGGYPKQGDGIHFTAEGHRMIAAKLVSRVLSAAH
ncbi:MAG TPA: GDSL-type esterase/lipase family protein [Pseudolabrys sp.]|nr:GDSL-type esterase/lipase family protein [Pseudolabrys sp.]